MKERITMTKISGATILTVVIVFFLILVLVGAFAIWRGRE